MKNNAKNFESANNVKNNANNRRRQSAAALAITAAELKEAGTPLESDNFTQLTPAQKAAITRAQNKAAKEAAAQSETDKAAKAAEKEAREAAKRKAAAKVEAEKRAKEAAKTARRELTINRQNLGGFSKCTFSFGASCAALTHEIDTPYNVGKDDKARTMTGREALTAAGYDITKTGGKVTPAGVSAVVSSLFKDGKDILHFEKVPAIFKDDDGHEKVCYIWDEKHKIHRPAALIVLRKVVKWSPAVVCRILADSPAAARLIEDNKTRNKKTAAGKVFYINTEKTATKGNARSTFKALTKEDVLRIVWAK